MSRIGKRILTIPANTEVNVTTNNVTVKGPKGTLEVKLVSGIEVLVEEGTVRVNALNNLKKTKAMFGTTNALISNALIGVSEGYSKGLEIIGVGYRFNNKNSHLGVAAGFSHPVELEIPSGLEVEYVNNTEIVVKGIDKQSVGEFSAVIRKVRPAEPYKGKGIRYKGENIRRKEPKKSTK